MRPLRGIYPAIVAAALCLAAEASAQGQGEQQDRLENVEKQISESEARRAELAEKADAAARELRAIGAELVRRTRRVQQQEDRVTDLEDRVREMNGQAGEKQTALRGKSQSLAETLAALQRLSQRPPELMLVKPGKATDAVRSAAALSQALPELQRQAKAIRQEIEELDRLRQSLSEERRALDAGLSALAAEVTDLDRLKRRRETKRGTLLAQASAESKRIERLAQQAKDLRGLIARLQEDSARHAGKSGEAIPGARSFASARGSLALPARGQLVMRFGAPTAAGDSKGIRILTRKGAQVVAPFDGRVVFSGNFRSYGQLLIIAHGEGYHTLLAGMAKIEGTVGQWLLAGEPVGVMGDGLAKAGPGEENDKTGPELYLEIRRNGDPVNPLPWLAAGSGKVGG
jgi:septal ring factor EnvC (AmiA/AmiB activator)